VANGFARRQDAEYFVTGFDRMPRLVDARDRFVRSEDCRWVESLFRSAQEEYRARADAR
jgi:hypothetical protein